MALSLKPLADRIIVLHQGELVVHKTLATEVQERRVHGQRSTIPARTATGNDTLPTTIRLAKPTANARLQRLNRGRFQPIDWNRLHDPWNRCTPSARLATMYRMATGTRLRLRSTLP